MLRDSIPRPAFVVHGLPIMACLLLTSFASCGPAPVPPTDRTPHYTSFEELKQRLAEVADHGEGGSALMGIQTSLEELKKVDAPKAEKLLKDFQRLDRAPDVAQRKQIARQMMDSI